MTDPFYMLMLLHRLGNNYFVWDKAASIRYEAPGRGTVAAEFRLEDAMVERLRSESASGAPVFPEFDVDVLDPAGTVVARVHKQLYVRLKPRSRPPEHGSTPSIDKPTVP